MIVLCAILGAIFAFLIAQGSPYLGWDYHDPETAVFGVAFHVFEWVFVRVSPIFFLGAAVGAYVTKKKP